MNKSIQENMNDAVLIDNNKKNIWWKNLSKLKTSLFIDSLVQYYKDIYMNHEHILMKKSL
jgi:hypothetical protein